MKWFEDLFTKSKMLIISGISGILIFTALIIIDIVTGFYSPIPNYAMSAVFSFLLLIAFKKSETSLQKALSSAMLAQMMGAYWSTALGVYGKSTFFSVNLIKVFMTVLVTVIFINHLLLQIDHKGEQKVIRISQIMLVAAIIVQFAELISQIFGNGQYFDLLNSFGLLCKAFMITCIEARIQKYKARRFAAIKAGTWTEQERQKSKKIFTI